MNKNNFFIKLILRFQLSTTVILNLVLYTDAVPIFNGEIANEKQFPFAVSFGLHAENSSSFQHFCGGSIIENDFKFSWAISAAHCFINFKQHETYAIIGSIELSRNPTELCTVQGVYMDEFNVYSFQNDIALVKIECQYPHHQQVIQISTIEPSRNLDCLIYGYGGMSYEINKNPSNKLHYGDVVVISHEECEKLVGRAIVPMPDTGQFCARGEAPKNSDACPGDSGSALICKTPNEVKYMLYGIVSYGMGCGTNTAGVYQSAAYHRHWIDSTLQNECQIGEEE